MRKPKQSKGPAFTEKLAGFSLFQGVKARTVEELAKHATEVAVPRRSTVYLPGDECTGLYLVISGRMKLALPLPDGGEKVVALISAGSWFGETALLLKQRQAIAAGAVQHSALLHLPALQVLECLADDRLFAVHLLTETCRRLHGTMLEMSTLTTSSARDRVISFLVDVLPTATYNGGAAKITLPAAKHVIASRLNLTPAHLSRVLAELKRDRIIGVEGQCVVVPDVRRLQASQRASAPQSDVR
jgi:CRP/FNR family transcriptional regulator, dissimilatory nitrate respiration regulator